MVTSFARSELRYLPELFHIASLDEAKSIIVTPEGTGMTSEQRWEVETRWLMERIGFDDDGIVIDYGCGAGRLAKEIKNPVVGVDMSRSMLIHAETYVDRPSFVGVSPHMFRVMVDGGLRASGAIAVWSLQHILEIHEAVDLLMESIRPGGILWLVNATDRLVPYMRPDGFSIFASDGVEVLPLIERWADLETSEAMMLYQFPAELRKYRRKSR